MIFMTEMSATL